MAAQLHLGTAVMQEEIHDIVPIPPASDGTPAEEWPGGVHPDGQLEVTKGFYLHAAKLSRILSYLAHERREGTAVYRQLAETTGMSEAQVKAFIQYGVFMELLVPRVLKVTPLGHLVLAYDPFFDRIGSLWLLHYMMASNPTLVVWNYMCNAVLPSMPELSKEAAADTFTPFAGRWSERSIRQKVPKELRAFFASYVTEMLTPLYYLYEVRDRTYAINRDVAPVPSLILLATILIYRDRFYPGASSIEIPTLVYADHSPGRLMRQGELVVRQALDQLHDKGYIAIESQANLDQVRFRSDVTWLSATRTYYYEQQNSQT